MSTERNKEIVRRLVAEYWNNNREEVLEESFAPDYVDHNPPPGEGNDRAAALAALMAFKAAFSDNRTTLDQLVAEGDKVAWRWNFTGTHTGEFMGVPPTGKQITLKGTSIDRFRDGKIVERWGEADVMGLMMQLGAVPSPG